VATLHAASVALSEEESYMSAAVDTPRVDAVGRPQGSMNATAPSNAGAPAGPTFPVKLCFAVLGVMLGKLA
jgi:hypothetical protein